MMRTKYIRIGRFGKHWMVRNLFVVLLFTGFMLSIACFRAEAEEISPDLPAKIQYIKNLTIFHCPYGYILVQDAIIPHLLTALVLPPIPSQILVITAAKRSLSFVFLFIYMYISPMINF